MAAQFDHTAMVTALENARTRRGLSWRRVAAEAGIEPTTLHRIIHGGSVPDLVNYVALVDWLGVSADEYIRRPDRFDVYLADGTPVELKSVNPADLQPGERQWFEEAVQLLHKVVVETRSAAASEPEPPKSARTTRKRGPKG